MSIKDLFNKDKKTLPQTSIEELGREIESYKIIEAKFKDDQKIIPYANYDDPHTFVRFGSAEEYYEQSIKRIYQSYPYDGSKFEKMTWHNSSSYLDEHVFETIYPRTNGYIVFSHGSWGTKVADFQGYGAPASSSYEYILIKGGPHRDPSAQTLPKMFPTSDGKSNVFNFGQNRESNLKIGGTDGNTVEFWLKKHAFNTTNTQKEVIFDLHMTESLSASVDYARLRIELSGGVSGTPFYATYQSGSKGFGPTPIGASLTPALVADNHWHHYAFSFINSGSHIRTILYVDGIRNQVLMTGSTVGYVSGALVATIGALAARPSGTLYLIDNSMGGGSATDHIADSIPKRGWGKLSASMDEFRFWKVARNAKEVGRHWFTQVGGGTNTDTANTHLGVYYKFNEGIVGSSSIDSTVLDYSGRISNGEWQGYAQKSRQTGSAMVEARAAKTEFKDPIIYSSHPDVRTVIIDKKDFGRIYDYSNNSSIYKSIPEWITSEDDYGTKDIKKLTQVMSSYFDQLALQIDMFQKLKNTAYVSGTHKPIPFANRLLDVHGLDVPELFVNASIVEKILERGEKREFKEDIQDVKNLIYQNIYNNLSYIYKSKGTEKSFRNALRCFGIDDELVKINIFASNTVYDFKENYTNRIVKKNYAAFNHTGSFEATVYQMTGSSNPETVSFVSGSSNLFDAGDIQTVEAEVIFPKALNIDSDAYAYANFNVVSLFGAHDAIEDWQHRDEVDELSWAFDHETSDFQVYAVKGSPNGADAYFKLTSSALQLNLTTDVYEDIYSDNKWNFAVRVKPIAYPWTPAVSGSHNSPGMVEFYGVNTEQGVIKTAFELTGAIGPDKLSPWLSGSKRLYVGAHRTNFTGSVIERSDAKISSVRFWYGNVSNEEVNVHAKDPTNYGTLNPQRNAFLLPRSRPERNLKNLYIPQASTLVLHWDFNNVSGSNEDGTFFVEDLSSGSLAESTDKYGWMTRRLAAQHTGKGHFFPRGRPFNKAVDKNYLAASKQLLPEMIGSSDMVEIRTQDDVNFTKESRPITHFISIEKSMYQTISEEILNLFATIKDFNNLIGAPVNRYRQEYKDLAKLRQLFFDRVGNTPDLERYIDYYKWIDASINTILMQLMPISANSSQDISTIVESHVLERSKYWTKFPTLEMKQGDPEGSLRGHHEQMYNWKFGHAPQYLSGFSSNKSISFNGTDDQSQLTVPDAANLSFGDGSDDSAFSISAWVKVRSFDEEFAIVNKWGEGTGSQDEYRFYITTSGQLIIALYDDHSGARVISLQRNSLGTAYWLNNWRHVVMTYDATEAATGLEVYIDGDLQTSNLTRPTLGSYTAMNNLSKDFVIGRKSAKNDNDVSDGLIDEVAIFDKELSAAEVTTLYNGGATWDLKVSFESDLISWWRMGDKAAGSAPNYVIKDQISSNHAVMSEFQGTLSSGVVIDSPPPASALGADVKKNSLWWKERALRLISAPSPESKLRSDASDIDGDRDILLKVINNKTDGKGRGPQYFNRFNIYSFTTDIGNSPPYNIHGGPNRKGNKNRDLLKQALRIGNQRYFQITSSDMVREETWNHDAAEMNPSKKFQYSFKIDAYDVSRTTDSTFYPLAGGTLAGDYGAGKGDLLAPFSFYSSSVASAGSIYDNNDPIGVVTNIHHDTYNLNGEVPMQGPFTEKYVGGMSHRHATILTTGSQDRAEAWNLELGDQLDGKTDKPRKILIQPRTIHQVRSQFLRDAVAKRPVNIANIHHTTGTIPGGHAGAKWSNDIEFTKIGNFDKRYQFVQTSGRTHNNRHFVEHDGNMATNDGTASLVYGISEWTLPTRNRHEYVFVERFSAPGGPEVMSRGFLDTAAEEFSVYNSMNYRNSVVRGAHNRFLNSPSGKFGLFSGTIASPGHYMMSASYHKTNRNPQRFFRGNNHYHTQDNSGEGTGLLTASVRYDNAFITRPIPQSDLQYKWIRDSLIGISSSMMPESRIRGGHCIGFWGTDPNFGGITGSIDEGLGNGWATPGQQKEYWSSECGYLYGSGGGVVGTLLYKNLGHYGFDGETWVKRLPFGYAQPNHAFAGSPSTDLQFVSASDIVTYPVGSHVTAFAKKGSSRLSPIYGGTLDHTFVDFVGLNNIIIEPITGNLLGYGQDMDSKAVNRDFYFDGTGFSRLVDKDNHSSCVPGAPTGQSTAYRGLNTVLINSSSLPANRAFSQGAIPGGIGFLNALLLNRGGVYGWPTWKQVRTSQHPIARYLRKSNILQSVNNYKEDIGNTYVHIRTKTDTLHLPSDQMQTPFQVFSDEGRSIDSYKIPPLTSKFKPMSHKVRYMASDQDDQVNTLRHTYGNLINFFPVNPHGKSLINTTMDLKLIPDKVLKKVEEKRIYENITDLIRNPSARSSKYLEAEGFTLINLSYQETVWPKEENTYLSGTRSRISYKETPGRGENGIDRIHGKHRTFWRDNPGDRLRNDQSMKVPTRTGDIFRAGSPNPNNNARNSQGYPIFSARDAGVFDLRFAFQINPTCLSTWPLDSSINENSEGSPHIAGELFSTDFCFQQGSHYELVVGANDTARLTTLYNNSWYNHTASLKYTWYNHYGSYNEYIGYGSNQNTVTNNIYGIEVGSGSATHNYASASQMHHFRPAYSASEFSNNAPWYDSYEEFSKDIRYMAKDYSIIPEFRISEHMDFYLQNDFSPKVINPKFMTIDGATEVSSSATRYINKDGAPASLNSKFYRLYSNTDFMKFIDIVKQDYEEGIAPRGQQARFVMKCKGIKKLLPYNGFYPVLRTIQLGSMLSESFAPHLIDKTDLHQHQGFRDVVDDGDKYGPLNRSEASKLQAILQPFMAPGILFNTIKAGVAVDWPIYTGSYIPSYRGFSSGPLGVLGYLTTGAVGNSSQKSIWGNIAPVQSQTPVLPNIRLPIEALVQPTNYLPIGTGSNIHILDKSRAGYKFVDDVKEGKSWRLLLDMSMGSYQNREGHATAWDGKGNHEKYELAMNNFLGEVPRFFLKDERVKSFASSPGPFSMISGTTYFMDVGLGKSDNMIISEGPDLRGYYIPKYNVNLTGGARGIYYGPAGQCKRSATVARRDDGTFQAPSRGPYVSMQDPCWAAFTPPYFYGEKVERIRFSPHVHRVMDPEEISNFSIEEIIRFAQKETVEHNVDIRDNAEQLRISASFELAPYVPDHDMFAVTASMKLDASVNLFNKIRVPEVEFEKNENNGQFEVSKMKDSTSDIVDLWSIGTKFECPALNFTGSLKKNDGTPSPHDHRYPRVMWMQYGKPPAEKEGLFMRIKESFPETTTGGTQGKAAAVDGLGTGDSHLRSPHGWPVPHRTGSLLKKLGFDKVQNARSPIRKIGEVANRKTVSEAIVAIPLRQGTGDPYFHFYQSQVTFALSGKGSNSIRSLVESQKKYVFPPHLDFVNNRDIRPIVMYVFEFEHTFDKDDLSDIWQNLMPKIARTAEHVESVIEHPLGLYGEFFNTDGLPDDLQWMVFKVKQRAESSYFGMLADSYGARLLTPDQTQNNSVDESKFDVQGERPKYSFNWPYDYFSLIELAKIDARVEYTDPTLEREGPEVPENMGEFFKDLKQRDAERGIYTSGLEPASLRIEIDKINLLSQKAAAMVLPMGMPDVSGLLLEPLGPLGLLDPLGGPPGGPRLSPGMNISSVGYVGSTAMDTGKVAATAVIKTSTSANTYVTVGAGTLSKNSLVGTAQTAATTGKTTGYASKGGDKESPAMGLNFFDDNY